MSQKQGAKGESKFCWARVSGACTQYAPRTDRYVTRPEGRDESRRQPAEVRKEGGTVGGGGGRTSGGD
jgi:hypothetical protein